MSLGIIPCRMAASRETVSKGHGIIEQESENEGVLSWNL